MVLDCTRAVSTTPTSTPRIGKSAQRTNSLKKGASLRGRSVPLTSSSPKKNMNEVKRCLAEYLSAGRQEAEDGPEHDEEGADGG